MPIDINLLREDRGGNPELVRESQRRRFASVELVDQVIAKDAEWRAAIFDGDRARKDRNKVQQEVSKKKKAKEECDDLVKQIQEYDKKVGALDAQTKQLKEELDKLLPKIGNIVDDTVPVSQDEDADTEVVRTWGTPRTGDDLLHHHDLLWRIGGFEPERGSAVAGHRAYFLRDAGLLLNQALISYGIAFLRKRQYSVLQPPYFMNRDMMAGVAQLEQFDEELYKVTGDDEKYLIATSEQPICGFHKGEWLDEKQLPLRYGGVSTCFRKEAGAHGKDCWGIFRVHQFDKVEQFVVCEGDLEVSRQLQGEMIAAAEEFYQSLGIAYRVVNIVSGELNNAAIKKFDLEGWFPGYDTYRELVSCSNCTDYQSRAMEIRCGVKKLGQDTKKYVHMLNSTLCACTRTICAILENFQTPEGVRVPEVLVPFMGGLTFIPFVREARKDAAAAKAADKKTKKVTPAAAAAAATAKAAAAATTATNGGGSAGGSEAEKVGAEIAAKGEEIRQLKVAKTHKAGLQPHVDALLALKKRYKELTGGEYAPAPAAAVPAKATKAPAPVAPAAVTGTGGPGAEIAGRIVAKGEEIRRLKAEKAEKAALEPHVAALLALKAEFKEATGQEYAAPAPAAAAGGKKGGADKAPAAPQQQKKGGAGAGAAAGAPAAAAAPAALAAIPGPLFDGAGSPNLASLDAYLQTRSYLRGFTPSQDDNALLPHLAGWALPDLKAKHPHLARWHQHVASFPPGVRAGWPQ